MQVTHPLVNNPVIKFAPAKAYKFGQTENNTGVIAIPKEVIPIISFKPWHWIFLFQNLQPKIIIIADITLKMINHCSVAFRYLIWYIENKGQPICHPKWKIKEEVKNNVNFLLDKIEAKDCLLNFKAFLGLIGFGIYISFLK